MNPKCQGITTKCVTFVVMVILADIAGLWIYFRLTFTSSVKRSELDPPDVIQVLQPSNSTFGVYSKAATVGTGGPCADYGKDILEKGGSAVDAAITVLLCEGVCVMQAMGVGGGFIMNIYNRTEKKAYSVVARETAPARATQTMYKDIPHLSTFGPLAAGIPGELKGYQEVHKRFGKLPWRELFQPTIKLCEEGVLVTEKMAFEFKQVEEDIKNSPSLRYTILNSTGGRLPEEGEYLKLPHLANTLRIIADSPNMADELYNGSLTKEFVADIQAGGGIITEEDMHNYKVRWENPVTANLSEGVILYSAPLPGSGVLVAFMLRMLDGFLQYADSDLRRSQIMIETFKHAYGRRTDLGDPHYLDPWILQSVLFNLTDENTIQELRSKIKYNETSHDVKFYGADYAFDDHGTNNVAILAADGSAVCVTSTINTWFGSTFVSKSTGILLNDQMDDFSTPGVVNYWGVAPSEANFIEPGKRPQSSMSPSIFVDSEGDVRLILGAAGGTTITTQVTAVAMRNLWLGKNIKEAIDAPRFHHQLIPMEVSYEYGVLSEMVQGWQKIGHRTLRRGKTQYPCAVVTGIARLGTKITANSDWRRSGVGVAGI